MVQHLCYFLLCLVVATTAKIPQLVIAASSAPVDKALYADTQPPPHMQTHPLLQISCAIQLEGQVPQQKRTPISTFVDTGAQVSVLSVSAAARAGVLQMMDRRYAGHAQGVGHCRVLGRLPAGVILLHMHGQDPIEAPAITILEHTNDGVDLLLGLDFLRDHEAILNLRTEEMTLQIAGNSKREVSIPFIKPRSALNFGGGGGGGEEGSARKILEDDRLCMGGGFTDDEDEDEEYIGPNLDMSGV